MLPSFISLPPEHISLLRLVADEASARGVAAYVVGGFVRDLLLEHPGLDLDIVIQGDAPALARALAKKHGGKVTAHMHFHTATWALDRGPRTKDGGLPAAIDLITARREMYARPGALPEVTPSTIEEDVRRRDFTINTLAVRLDGEHFGELYDPFNGADDIRQGLVRVLHPGSFIDDPTRIFRAARYEQRYGFRIEPGTLALIPGGCALLGALSAERLRHELDLILDEPHAAATLARLDGLGVLEASGGLPWSADVFGRLDAALAAGAAVDWDLGEPQAELSMRRILGYSSWLLDLAPAQIEALQARLVFPLVVLKPVRAAAALYADLGALSGARPSQWAERLDELPLAAVYAVYLASGEQALETYAVRWRMIRAHTDGETLKVLGLPPGPRYKKILSRLRAAWLDGEVGSVEQEKDLLEKLLST